MLFQIFLVCHVVSVVFGSANRADADNFGGQCNFDSLAVYKVSLEGHWSQETFPKHFPEKRPPAHFSKTYGISHDYNFTLFEIDQLASTGLSEFCQTSESTTWENDDHVEEFIFDEFIIPKLEDPSSKIESRLFVQSNYSYISLVTKLIPSPDWFIGIDQLQLCRNNRWVEKISIEARPLDCGVLSGMTFTSPVFKSSPQEKVYKITAKHPNHHASSFFYEDKTNAKLPPIAYFRLQKIKEYVGVKEKSVKRIHQKYRRHDNISSRKTKPKRRLTKQPENAAAKNNVNYEPGDCVVSEWSQWTNCTKTCGLGEKFRNRSVEKQPKNGFFCPHLTERSWCGSSRCKPSLVNENISNSSYFMW